MKCFVCGKGRLNHQSTNIGGETHGEKHVVSMMALVCSACGHVALEGKDVQELMRLVADAYRRKNGLLTSREIREIRGEMSQQEFAEEFDCGVASIKRWELGAVQSKRYDKAMRSFRSRPKRQWTYSLQCGVAVSVPPAFRTGASPVGLPHGPPASRMNGILDSVRLWRLEYDNFAGPGRNSRRVALGSSLRIEERYPSCLPRHGR